jgi:hypothetical protein
MRNNIKGETHKSQQSMSTQHRARKRKKNVAAFYTERKTNRNDPV